jgi:hypothetical protein
LEWRIHNYRRQKHISLTADSTGTKPSGVRYRRSIPKGPRFRWSYRNGAGVRLGIKEGSRRLRNGVEYARYRRDVRDVTKYVETAIVIDKAMVSTENTLIFELIHLCKVLAVIGLMSVPCVIRRSRNNQRHALIVPLLYSIY